MRAPLNCARYRYILAATALAVCAAAAFILSVASPARADWNPGDPYKMHYPQLLDPQGWDVQNTMSLNLADDWQCTQTGPVSDIHLWGSWRGNQPATINPLVVTIYDNIPADSSTPYSRPGNILWKRYFDASEFSIRPYGTGQQGWYTPYTGNWTKKPDPLGLGFYQINIQDIAHPFIQHQGSIYWLDMRVKVPFTGPLAQWAWKTSQNHFAGDAVWAFVPTGDDSPPVFQELLDPLTGESLDLAFVITPEPATLGLLLAGSLTLLKRQK